MDSLSYKDVKATAPSFTQSSPYNLSWIRGYKSYGLSNHLGNVLATISDIKFGADTNNDGVIDYYTADVVGASDYYPFGATMPNRITGTSYRYGFNGKEKDKEGSVQYDYGFRIYDPRLGRFKSVDPLTKQYPELSPYQFASNTPIQAVDLDGLEKYIIHYKIEDGKNVILKQVTDYSLKYIAGPTIWNQPKVKMANVTKTYTLSQDSKGVFKADASVNYATFLWGIPADITGSVSKKSSGENTISSGFTLKATDNIKFPMSIDYTQAPNGTKKVNEKVGGEVKIGDKSGIKIFTRANASASF